MAKVLKHGLSYRWAILGVCWLAYLVAFMQRLSIGPLAPFLKEDLNLTSTEIGFLMSASGIGYMLTTVPAGWLVDRVGVRRMLLIGELVGGIFIIGMFTITNLAAGLVFMFLAGLGMGCLMPSTTKAVVVWFPVNERATAMGFKQTALNAGGIITAATLPTLALALSWRYGFVIIGVVGIIIGIVSFILYRNPPVQSTAPTTSEPVVLSNPGLRLRDILKGRDIWLIGFAGTCMAAVEFSAMAHFVLYSEEVLLFPVVTAGMFLAVLEAGGAFGRPISGAVSDRLWRGNRRRPYIMMCATAGAVCLILSFFQQGIALWILVPLLLLFGFTGIGWAGLHLTIAAEISGARLAGTVTGMVSVIAMIGTVTGPPVFGYIIDATGSYHRAWQLLALVALIAAILLFFAREKKREE
ncbi:MFS transporter [Chloroflexota bacterium]